MALKLFFFFEAQLLPERSALSKFAAVNKKKKRRKELNAEK